MMWFDLPDLLPPAYRGILSMFAAADAENEELKAYLLAQQAVMMNFYIQTCDEERLEWWESALQITPFAGQTLDARRARIFALLNNQNPYTLYFFYYLFLGLIGPYGAVTGKWAFVTQFLYGSRTLILQFNGVSFDVQDAAVDVLLKAKPAHVRLLTQSYDTCECPLTLAASAPSQYSVEARCELPPSV